MSAPLSGPTPMADPFGAVWCEVHGRRECSHLSKRSGVRCHAIAIAGMNSCDHHVGKSRAVAKAQGQAMLAWQMARPGAVSVDYRHAVLAALQMTYARLAWYAWLLEQQQAAVEDQASTGEDSGDGLAASVATGGLVGHTFAPSRDGGGVVTGEAIRGLAVLEAQERDRLVRFAKTAHDMEIDESLVRLEEQKGVLLVAGLRWLEGQLGLSEEQLPLFRAGAPRMLRMLAAGEIEQGGAA